MVVEGIAALSLAANVIQLVNFSIRIHELTRHFREDCGELPENLRRIEILINDIVPVCQRLQDASTSSSELLLDKRTLFPLLDGCRRATYDFHLVLENLRSTGQSGGRCFILALKMLRNAGKIDKIERALESYKASLTLRYVDASLNKQYVRLN